MFNDLHAWTGGWQRAKTDSQPIRIVIVDIYILEHLTNRTSPTYITLWVHSKDLSGLPGAITNEDVFQDTVGTYIRGRGTDHEFYLSNPNLNRKTHREIKIEAPT